MPVTVEGPVHLVQLVQPLQRAPPDDETGMMAGSPHVRRGRLQQTAGAYPSRRRGTSRATQQGETPMQAQVQVPWARWPPCWVSGTTRTTPASVRLSRRNGCRGRPGPYGREVTRAAATSRTRTRPTAPVSSLLTSLTQLSIRSRSMLTRPKPGVQSAPSPLCATPAGGGEIIINLTRHLTMQSPQALVVGHEIHAAAAAAERRQRAPPVRSRGGDRSGGLFLEPLLFFPL